MTKTTCNLGKRILCATLIGGTLIAGAQNSEAALTIDYTVPGGAIGSIYYHPANDGFLHGTAVAVSSVAGDQTPQNGGTAGTLAIAEGALNFTTGALLGVTQVNTSKVWTFGPGGSISLTGGIPGIALANGSTLLSGEFTSASIIELPLGQLKFDIAGATFGNTHNPSLYSYFGIPADYNSSDALSLTFTATNPDGGFTSTSILGGSVTEAPQPTPLPAAVWLFGSGVAGVLLRRVRPRV